MNYKLFFPRRYCSCSRPHTIRNVASIAVVFRSGNLGYQPRSFWKYSVVAVVNTYVVMCNWWGGVLAQGRWRWGGGRNVFFFFVQKCRTAWIALVGILLKSSLCLSRGRQPYDRDSKRTRKKKKTNTDYILYLWVRQLCLD